MVGANNRRRPANSLQKMLYSRLDEMPTRPAIAFYTGSGEYTWYTAEQFHAHAQEYAERLRGHGLKRGDVCILVLPSDEFCAKLVLASLLVGAVPLLVAPPLFHGPHSSLLEILLHTIDRTKAAVVVCPESMAHMGDELRGGRRHTRFLFGEADVLDVTPEAVQRVAPAETDVAAMQLTSGTTGFPRICVWQQRNVVAALDGMARAMKLRHDDVCFNWTPLYHDMGLVNNFFLSLSEGIPLVMMNPHDFVKNPALWLCGLAETVATITWSPNFGFAITAQRVKDSEIADVRLDHVRAFWNAAERIHLNTLDTFYERFSPYGLQFKALKTNFGCAENVGGATFSDPDGPFIVEHIDRVLFQKQWIAQPVPNAQSHDDRVLSVVGVGRPHLGIRIKVLDGDGRPAPDGYVGEIALESPSPMAGYLGDEAASQNAIVDGLVRTGDLGYLRNNELFWVGRVRERITVRGKKLDPSDFEPVLLYVSGVRPGSFAAFGVDDETRGTQRIVIVAEVAAASTRAPRAIVDEIYDTVFLRLGVAVDDVVLVQQGTLTKTSSGKRRHQYFRQLYLDGSLESFRIPEEPVLIS